MANFVDLFFIFFDLLVKVFRWPASTPSLILIMITTSCSEVVKNGLVIYKDSLVFNSPRKRRGIMREEYGEASKMMLPNYVFGLLAGTWHGDGTGEYPTIESFNYREKLTFERRGETSLFYLQRTERFVEGQVKPITSHWESGFIEALETGELQLANIQVGGRGEILAGRIERTNHAIKLLFKSESLSNDERMVNTTRVFELDGDILRYEMAMATTRVGGLTMHVFATLKRRL
jgi:hypothetical protein